MTDHQYVFFSRRARIIKALAHPARLCIVDELSRGPQCVRSLTRLVGSEMPTVSRHLAQLREAGIIEDKKKGVQVFYSLKAPCVLQFFHCLQDLKDFSEKPAGSCGCA